jgi:hypothetical protein
MVHEFKMFCGKRVLKVRNKKFGYYYQTPTATRVNKEKQPKNEKKVLLSLLMHINNKIKKNTYLYKIRVFLFFIFLKKCF